MDCSSRQKFPLLHTVHTVVLSLSLSLSLFKIQNMKLIAAIVIALVSAKAAAWPTASDHGRNRPWRHLQGDGCAYDESKNILGAGQCLSGAECTGARTCVSGNCSGDSGCDASSNEPEAETEDCDGCYVNGFCYAEGEVYTSPDCPPNDCSCNAANPDLSVCTKMACEGDEPPEIESAEDDCAVYEAEGSQKCSGNQNFYVVVDDGNVSVTCGDACGGDVNFSPTVTGDEQVTYTSCALPCDSASTEASVGGGEETSSAPMLFASSLSAIATAIYVSVF